MPSFYDVIVVGGGTAGVTAATTARHHYPDKKVLLVRKEGKTLVPCGIPYMFGILEDPLENANPDYVLEYRGVEVTVSTVTHIDREKKEITLAAGEKIGFAKLILATGSFPVMPAIPGIERNSVYWVQKDLPYLQTVLNALDKAKQVVIVGGGFVGVELAEQIRKYRNLEVTVLEFFPYCLYTSFDEEVCFEAERELGNLGVKIVTGHKVAELTGNERVESVRLDDGSSFPVDVALITTGVRPVTSLAEKAGLALGPTGAVMVDKTMTTSDPDIFACGDCAEKFSFFDGQPARIRLASVAATEARVAAANLYTRRRQNHGTVGVFSTFIGTKGFGCAGLTERMAEKGGYQVLVGEASAPNRHPSSLPNTTGTKIKLVFDRYTKALLGGQVIGGSDTGELVNILSACLQHRMTATQMAAFQMGTHPMLTPAPAAYPLVVAAEAAAAEGL